MSTRYWLFAAFLALTVIPPFARPHAQTNNLEVSGYIAGDLRIFPDEASHERQRNQHLNPSIVLRPEFSYEWNDGYDRFDFIPYARIDFQDDERRHADVREAKYLHIGEDWDLRVGFDKVFWGVTESRHLVDIVNQTDAVEDIDGEDKLGQPMVNLGLQRNWGNVNLFVMPYFRERTFPGTEGRLRGILPVDTDRATYESRLAEWHPDVALRYSTFVGEWDIGLAHFHGTSREPRFSVAQDGGGRPILVPRYDVIDQTSIDLQATFGAWLWKLESIYRTGHEDSGSFGAVSAGVEYTLFGLVDVTGDLGLLAEYHYDGRGADAPATQFDDDIFLGARLTLNDVQDTDFLAGILIDRKTQARAFSVEADRRLDDVWSLEVEGRAYDGIPDSDPAYGLRNDHHILIRLFRYL